MEWWGWVAWVASLVTGGTGIWFGYRADRRAAKAQASADSANARAAAALEEANRIALRDNPPEKPPWGDAGWVSGDLFAIRNNSGRVVTVLGVDADNERLAGLLRHRREYPAQIDPGDSLEVLAVGTMAGRPSPIITWHWHDEPDNPQRTRRGAIKP